MGRSSSICSWQFILVSLSSCLERSTYSLVLQKPWTEGVLQPQMLHMAAVHYSNNDKLYTQIGRRCINFIANYDIVYCLCCQQVFLHLDCRKTGSRRLPSMEKSRSCFSGRKLWPKERENQWGTVYHVQRDMTTESTRDIYGILF